MAAAPFSSRHLKNYENEKISLCLKIAEICMMGQIWVEKNDSEHKSSLLKLNPFSGGKYPRSMTCSLLEREILWCHISKTSKAAKFKFCIRHAFITIMTYAKFYLSQLMIHQHLFLASGPLPSRAWRMTEKAGHDRVTTQFPLL